MLNNLNSPIFTLLTFGLTTLLVGGFVGGEITRQRYVKEEIKAIEQQHKEILTRIEAAYHQSLANEQRALAQVDSIYTIVGLLDIKEGEIRGNIKKVQAAAKQGQGQTKKTLQTLADQGKNSIIDFDN